MMSMEDTWLVWRFNRGDGDAVRLLYEKYKCQLLALALTYLHDRVEAEDTVHDVFVAFLRLERFHLTGSVKGYLSTCVANQARNRLRGRARHPQEALEETMPQQAPEPQPDVEAIFGEENRLLARALARLPEEQREAVMLHLQGGLTFAQIAETREVSVSTVQARYRYGLEKLRSQLKREEFSCVRTTLSKNQSLD